MILLFNHDPPIYSTRITCYLAISSTGDVYPCMYDVGEKTLCSGNLKKDSLAEIWHTDKGEYAKG